VLYVSGFVLLGASFQKDLSIAMVIMGWGISQVGIMVNTVAVCQYLDHCAAVANILSCYVPDAYGNDCFPRRQVCSQHFRKQVADGFGTGRDQRSH
jgi:hypothetical protein